MTHKDRKPTSPVHRCTLRRLTPILPAAFLSLSLCPVAAHAQGGGGLTGDLSYTRGSGSGGYGSHTLAATIEPAALPLSLGFDATQNTVDSVESSTQLGATVGWRVSPVWSLAGHVSTLNDDLVNVSGRGLSIAWNLHKLWQGRRTTRLEVERNLYDYSLQSGSDNLNGRIPQQGRTRLDIRQGLSDALEVYMAVENYDYSLDPVDMARALLNRKARRVLVAGKLGDLLDRSQTLGLSWSVADAWNLDVSTSQSSTVIGQNQRLNSVALSYMFHPRSSVTLVYSDSGSDTVTSPSGVPLVPSQSDSTVELGLKWLF